MLVLWSGNVGGAETQTVELAGALKGLGIDASALFVCNAQPLGDRLSESAVPFQELGFDRGTQVFLAPRRFVRALRQMQPDAVILAEGAPLAPLTRMGSGRAAIVHVQHTGYFWYSYQRRALELVGGACRRVFVDTDVAVSDYVLEVMRDGLHAARATRIYNGVDLSKFRPTVEPTARERLVVAYAGRLGPGKGVEDLVVATSLAMSRYPLELRIAGAGPNREALERLAADRLGAGAFRFVGQRRDMPTFWGETDIAVVPSNGLIESFGMVAAEAMACGKAVIASRAGGLREVVAHDETGLLFDPGDSAALAECIGRYASDADLRVMHGAAARGRVERLFDIQSTARAYAALCEDLAARRRA